MLKFGKQSSLKQKWEVSLKSSSLFVRNHVSKIVLNKYIYYFNLQMNIIMNIFQRDSVIGSTIDS